jgi:hypothetical protein
MRLIPPQFRGRRRGYGRSADFDIDAHERQIVRDQVLSGRASSDSDGLIMIPNNSDSAMLAGRFYGRDSDGIVSIADPNGADRIKALWLCMKTTASGLPAPVMTRGRAKALVSSGTTPQFGGLAYVVSGIATPEHPASGFFQVIGNFADTMLDDDDMAWIDLDIRSVEGGLVV